MGTSVQLILSTLNSVYILLSSAYKMKDLNVRLPNGSTKGKFSA